jgi:hypothetical protein
METDDAGPEAGGDMRRPMIVGELDDIIPT